MGQHSDSYSRGDSRSLILLANGVGHDVLNSRLGQGSPDRLRQLDQVAYVRFASVYREFKDARDFVEELEPMLKEAQTE